MYGKQGGGGGYCVILDLCGEWVSVAVSGRVPTNNELVNVAPSKEAEEGACLLHCNVGVGRWSIPPTIGGRPYSHREQW